MVLQRFRFTPFFRRKSKKSPTDQEAKTARKDLSAIGDSKSSNDTSASNKECIKNFGGGDDVHASECSSQDFVKLAQVESRHSQQPHVCQNPIDVAASIGTSNITPLNRLISRTMAYDADAPSSTAEVESGALILDPEASDRQYYSDPYTGIQREIWRPGDGDGDKSVDYYEWSGPQPPLEKRWRFYQSRTGDGPIKIGVNEPPKYVILDDRAAYEVLASDIPRKSLTRFWQHDFGGTGVARARRPHRGRAAIGDPQAPGQERYHFASVGKKKERYYFVGEEDYKPIIYHRAEPTVVPEIEDESHKRKAPSSSPDALQPPQKLHHNQYTNKALLVKNGAPGFGIRKRGKHTLIPALRWYDAPSYLPAHPDLQAKLHAQQQPHIPAHYGDEVKSVLQSGDSIGLMYQPTPAVATPNLENSSDMEEFPFARRSESIMQSDTARPELAASSENEQENQHDFFSDAFTGEDVIESMKKDNGYFPEISSAEASHYVSPFGIDVVRTLTDRNVEPGYLKKPGQEEDEEALAVAMTGTIEAEGKREMSESVYYNGHG